MELMHILTPESPEPNDAHSGGQVIDMDDDAFDKLFPKTTIDHLLSEEERRKAAEERREFEAVGRTMCWTVGLYPLVYASTRKRLESGVSYDEIRAEISTFPLGPAREDPENPEAIIFSAIRDAYGDVLAGRPPRFSSSF
jgi:hypothetical protein